ncbi:MAG: CAP family protein [Sandaracinaceae bacterium]|nr:CAP family protein [Sandaracinaceae bacterium]
MARHVLTSSPAFLVAPFVVAPLLVACGAAARSEDTTAPTRGERPAASSSAPSDPRMAALLDAHNVRRSAHCAAPLTWSDEVAAHAQRWADHLAANGCRLEHSGDGYGENLAAGTAGTLSPEDVAEMWYRERAAYDFATGGFSMDTGHFTQLVWTSSAHLGCGVASCGGLDVWVCNYDPPGNYEGQYRESVLPTSCR